MNSKTDVIERSGSTDCYAAVLERAKRTVEQWDKHDQYRQTEADKLLNDPQIGEPDDVAIARTVLRLNDVMKLAECQYMGCGGNLKPDEVVKSMRGILRDAIDGFFCDFKMST